MKRLETNDARVLSVNVSDRTGVVKRPVDSAELKTGGVVGDAHFGLSEVKQVSLLADESANKMRNLGLSIDAGSFAENITTVGIDLKNLPVGTRLRVGESLCEVSQIGKECHEGCAIKQQAGVCVMPSEGIFTRVLKDGRVKPGDAIVIV
ncbi:MAG: MOSC domain-containing protein [Clostridiales Family XIII bacterium]|jgi:cyclic pyranopterin phosphate synthase|nr:MOSC domain-containing protein [Clostridiales Family XIII bacterium]